MARFNASVWFILSCSSDAGEPRHLDQHLFSSSELEFSRNWVQEKFVVGILLEILDHEKVEAVLQFNGDVILPWGKGDTSRSLSNPLDLDREKILFFSAAQPEVISAAELSGVLDS